MLLLYSSNFHYDFQLCCCWDQPDCIIYSVLNITSSSLTIFLGIFEFSNMTLSEVLFVSLRPWLLEAK